jgi:hypothetical protein
MVAEIQVEASNPGVVVQNAFAVFANGATYQTLHVSKDLKLNADPILAQALRHGLNLNEVLFTNLDQTFSQVAVPEPGSIVLFGTAFLGCAAVLRRRLTR